MPKQSKNLTVSTSLGYYLFKHLEALRRPNATPRSLIKTRNQLTDVLIATHIANFRKINQADIEEGMQKLSFETEHSKNRAFKSTVHRTLIRIRQVRKTLQHNMQKKQRDLHKKIRAENDCELTNLKQPLKDTLLQRLKILLFEQEDSEEMRKH